MKSLLVMAAAVALSACATYTPSPEQATEDTARRQVERDAAGLRRANDDAMKTIGGF